MREQAIIKHLGPAMRRLRRERRLSLSQVAADTGLSPSQLKRYEEGHIAIPAPTLRHWLAGLGGTVLDLQAAIGALSGGYSPAELPQLVSTALKDLSAVFRDQDPPAT
jgi:transcriptional regulator with XRE-family HTH domain